MHSDDNHQICEKMYQFWEVDVCFLCYQALRYLSNSGAELPRVVERETIKEDGTVVRRCVNGGVTLCVLCSNSYTRLVCLFNNACYASFIPIINVFIIRLV